MIPSEHPIKPAETLSNADLAQKCLENPGYTSVGIPYHLERERRRERFNQRIYLMAGLAAAAALATLCIEIVNLIM